MSMTSSMQAAIIHTDGRYKFAAAAAYKPGEVIVRPDNTLAILPGFEDVAIGDEISPEPIHPTLIAEFAASSTDTWAAKTILYWDDTANELTTTIGSNTRVGVAIFAKTSGQTKALVNCVPAYPPA